MLSPLLGVTCARLRCGWPRSPSSRAEHLTPSLAWSSRQEGVRAGRLRALVTLGRGKYSVLGKGEVCVGGSVRFSGRGRERPPYPSSFHSQLSPLGMYLCLPIALLCY